MTKCPFCQFDNEDGALFCEQCKSDLGMSAPVVATASPPADVVGAAAVSIESIPMAADPATAAPVAAVALEATPDAVAVPIAQIAPDNVVGIEASVAAVVAPLEASPVAFTTEPLPAPLPEECAVSAPEVGETPAPAAATTPDTASPFAAALAESAASTVAGSEAARLPPGTKPKLVVVRGQKVNNEYDLYDGDNYIGRADDKPVDIDLEDQEPPDRIWSSRQHALITYEDGLLTIEDLNSTNGTFVNRTRVHPGQKRPLQVNDLIQIGTVHLKVRT